MFYTTEEQFENFERNRNKQLLKFYIALTIIMSIIFIFISLSHADERVKIDMWKIYKIESSNNPLAYNKHSRARGLGQITPVVLKDWNNWSPQKYTLDDLYIPAVNKEISNWYMNVRLPRLLSFYKQPDTIRNRLIAYNWGIGNLIKWRKNGGKLSELPKETLNYIKKYKEI